jgi:hypothetical protein
LKIAIDTRIKGMTIGGVISVTGTTLAMCRIRGGLMIDMILDGEIPSMRGDGVAAANNIGSGRGRGGGGGGYFSWSFDLY